MLNRSKRRLTTKARSTIGLFIALTGISTMADARAFACECSFSSGGSQYEVAYVVESSSGGGCCTGSPATALVLKKQGGRVVEGGYTDGGFGQGLCCDNSLPEAN